MKALTSLILKKLGIAVSGPIGWVASLLIDKLLAFLFELIKKGAIALYESYKIKQARKEETKAEERYEDTLQDGANEQNQIDATIDVINSGGPK